MATSASRAADTSAAPPNPQAVRHFVRSPFAVRCNMVKVWRPLPAGLWHALAQPEDAAQAKRAERRAAAAVIFMALLLVAGFAPTGFHSTTGVSYPLIGKAITGHTTAPGWYYLLGHSWVLIAWVVVPSLAGWALVRCVWIPLIAARKPTRSATLAFAQHLGSVYLFVYMMIVTGAVVMVPLVWLAPGASELLRWCLWCFLFGESFFVPAAIWLRLVMADRSGDIFGRHRFAILTTYLAFCVVLPICGMVQQLD